MRSPEIQAQPFMDVVDAILVERGAPPKQRHTVWRTLECLRDEHAWIDSEVTIRRQGRQHRAPPPRLVGRHPRHEKKSSRH